MAFFEEFYDDYSGDYNYSSDPLSEDTSQVYPVVSTDMQSSDDSSFGGVLQKLGSIGSTAARLGTAVGTIQRDVENAKHNYTTARVNAKTGNSLGTFWMYATPTEKMMIVLAAAAIAVTILKD